VNPVPAGPKIKVCPDTDAGQLRITKALTLTAGKGASHAVAVVVPPSGGLVQNGSDIFGNTVAAQILVASPDGKVTIERLTVDGTGNGRLYHYNAGGI
jgi:hypothetical protein